jgi:hypothetical protein
MFKASSIVKPGRPELFLEMFFHGLDGPEQFLIAIKNGDLGVHPGGRQRLGRFDSGHRCLPERLARPLDLGPGQCERQAQRPSAPKPSPPTRKFHRRTVNRPAADPPHGPEGFGARPRDTNGVLHE